MTTINDGTTPVSVTTEGGTVVADTTPSVTIVTGQAEAVIRPDVNAVIVVNQSVSAQGPAFQNLFIGFPSSFPAVTHASVLLKSGQYADPTIYEPWILDED